MKRQEYIDLMCDRGIDPTEAELSWSVWGEYLLFLTPEEFDRALGVVCRNEFLFPGDIQ